MEASAFEATFGWITVIVRSFHLSIIASNFQGKDKVLGACND